MVNFKVKLGQVTLKWPRPFDFDIVREDNPIMFGIKLKLLTCILQKLILFDVSE